YSFLQCYRASRHLHSFPTRRSSDLLGGVPLERDRMTIAVPSRIAGVATGARVGRREQHEPTREHDGPLSPRQPDGAVLDRLPERDRKSTRLNSSHVSISYAVFCLKK